jgi:hypothetical protein
MFSFRKRAAQVPIQRLCQLAKLAITLAGRVLLAKDLGGTTEVVPFPKVSALVYGSFPLANRRGTGRAFELGVAEFRNPQA